MSARSGARRRTSAGAASSSRARPARERREFWWKHRGKVVRVVYDILGVGPEVLCLPSMSTVSTREELRGVAGRLAAEFRVVLLDWPGFGESTRARFLYRPDLYNRFLDDLLESTPKSPFAVVAAGHAAGYALSLAARRRSTWSKIALVAPTWVGPLRAMAGPHPTAFRVLEAVIRTPLVGHALYRMNTRPSVIGSMLREHAYGSPERVDDELVREKQGVSRRLGARFAPAAFVTGGLDPFRSREELLSRLRQQPAPVLMLVGERTPRHSRAEMDAIAAEPGVETKILPGSLLLHEEHPDEAADVILGFLRS